MKENFVKLSQEIIFLLIAASAAVFPLLFLPTTTEFFDFNKFAAILVITFGGLTIWVVRMLIEKKASFARTPLDVPIIVFTTIVFISAFQSIDQFSSIFGHPQRIWPSFFPIVILAAFYFLTVSNLKKRKQVNIILQVFALSTAIASAIAIVSYFGLFLPFDFAQIRSFNTVGVINRLALLQAFIIPLTAYWAIFEKDKLVRPVALIATLVLLFSLILINSVPAYIGIAVAALFISASSLKTKMEKQQQGALVLLAIFTILFLVIRFVPQVSTGTLNAWIQQKDSNLSAQEQIKTPQEATLPRQTAWDLAAQAIGKRPLFGTGPNTYQFVYTQLKPRNVNSTDQWAIRFSRSTSDITDYVATLGIFGVLAYFLLIVAALRFIWALTFRSQHNAMYIGLSAAIISYFVTGFLTTSSFATFGGLFLGLALLSALAKSQDESHVYDVTVELATLRSKFAWFPLGTPESDLIKTQPAAKGGKSQILPIVILVALLIAAIFSFKYEQEAYRGEYYFRQSLLASRSNNGNKTISNVQKAIAANPRVDTYHRSLAQFSLNAAINLTGRGELSDSERQILSQLAQVGVDQAKIASGYQILPLRLPGISAANVENWEVLSSVYQALIGSVGGADVHATNTLAQAVALDPQNPILHDRLGQLYQRLGNLDLALRKFEDSTVVKGDYGPGHYRLAKLLIEREAEVPRIVNELTLAKRLLDSNDPAQEDIEKQLETYNRQLRELQEEANAQIEAQGVQTSPSPSPSASPTPSPSPSPSASPTQSPSL